MLHHDVPPEPIKLETDPVDGRLLAETIRQYPHFEAPAWLLKTMEGTIPGYCRLERGW